MQPHAQSLFLFPIVFGIKLIHFFDGKDGAAEHSMACSILHSLFAPFERQNEECYIYKENEFFGNGKFEVSAIWEGRN